jgi:hypothetical protein
MHARGLLIGLAVSVGLHALVMGAPGWKLTLVEAPPERIEAQLRSAPRPAVRVAPDTPPVAIPPPPPSTPARPPKPAAPPPQVRPAAPVPRPAEPAAEAVALAAPLEQAAPASTPVAAPPADSDVPDGAGPDQAAFIDLPVWPRRGRIEYAVSLGKQGLVVGQTTHSWEHDGQRYSMQAVVETIGLAAVFKRFHYVQRSEGRIVRGTLRPDRFSVVQEGKKPEAANFDWKDGRVIIERRGRTREAPIKAGDQDVLSLWHQLSLIGEPEGRLEMTVVSNKAAAPSVLETVGEERLLLPIGAVDTYHLRARAQNASLDLDIWLAGRFGYLPVRIRIRDGDGDTFDQQARSIELGDTETARAGDGDGTAPVVVNAVEAPPLDILRAD